MRLTAAFCTWNRSALLRETLESFTRLSIPDGVEWDLVAVNNNSTDDTPAVLESFRRRLPLRPILESKQGVSYARNAAIDNATGDYMLWTDDDVMVDPNWMHAYLEAIRRWPDAALFGGPVRPHFEGKPPSWLITAFPKIETAFAMIDLGANARALSSQDFRLPYGANYAARTTVQRRHRFDPSRGKVGGYMMFGEETDVMRRILDDVPVGRWVPDAIVRHWITKERQTLGYIRAYFEAQGRSRIQFRKEADGPRLLRRPRWLWRSLVATHARYWRRRAFGPPERWIEDFVEASVLRGMFAAYGMPALLSGRR